MTMKIKNLHLEFIKMNISVMDVEGTAVTSSFLKSIMD